jgi:hypothetical protein
LVGEGASDVLSVLDDFTVRSWEIDPLVVQFVKTKLAQHSVGDRPRWRAVVANIQPLMGQRWAEIVALLLISLTVWLIFVD